MKAGLDRYRTMFLNKNGGFSLWPGIQPSVFHTALAISVIGKLKPYLQIEEDLFTNARDFLK